MMRDDFFEKDLKNKNTTVQVTTDCLQQTMQTKRYKQQPIEFNSHPMLHTFISIRAGNVLLLVAAELRKSMTLTNRNELKRSDTRSKNRPVLKLFLYTTKGAVHLKDFL